MLVTAGFCRQHPAMLWDTVNRRHGTAGKEAAGRCQEPLSRDPDPSGSRRTRCPSILTFQGSAVSQLQPKPWPQNTEIATEIIRRVLQSYLSGLGQGYAICSALLVTEPWLSSCRKLVGFLRQGYVTSPAVGTRGWGVTSILTCKRPLQ